MEYIKTEIEGVWVIEPKVFNDQRGYFFEAFKQAEFDEQVITLSSYKTMSLNRALVCCEDCIIKRASIRRLSW